MEVYCTIFLCLSMFGTFYNNGSVVEEREKGKIWIYTNMKEHINFETRKPKLVAKSLQSCPTLCDPIDGSPPGSPIPGILQARTLEWVAISFSNAWTWKWKWSHSVVTDSQRPHGLQPTRLLCPWEFPGESTGVGCHCLLQT